MEVAVGALLDAHGLTLGLAESVTGGLIGARMTTAPGASSFFPRGSVVSYASDVKHDLLDVPEGPVVSGEAAAAMRPPGPSGPRCRRRPDRSKLTGVAGPADQDGQPPGTVFVGLALDGAGDGTGADSVHLRLPGDRDRIRQFAAITALDLLRHRLLARRGPRQHESCHPAQPRLRWAVGRGGGVVVHSPGTAATILAERLDQRAFAGWFTYQPLHEHVVAAEPDVLD